MENKQFTSNDLEDHSQLSNGFQADRFVKKTVLLSIPDTIPENCSAELSGESLKMEAPKVTTEIFNGDCDIDGDKENISSSQPITSNKSLNSSAFITIDNSYIKQCERKLLDNSEDDMSVKNKSLVDKQLLEVPRMATYPNDSISTPPSVLRKEISLLRNEMAEVHEFHDFEIQLLKEEKLQNETDSNNYSELISKYSALIKLYTSLKTEYENYRAEEQQKRQEIQSKTADCLESLCSQIEASDNSLNFSSTSFASFNEGIKSSTMLEDHTEVEATILHDATVLANDPLSITNDVAFKTPMATPLKSSKKLLFQELNAKPIVREVKEIIAKRDPEYNIELLNVETALYDKIKEVEDLEQRLFKIEDLATVLQSELERITTENNSLKDSLTKKAEQLNELTQKLFTETISLDPSLRDSLVDTPETKLLYVFIETIMESCRKIQEEEVAKHNNEKLDWESKTKTHTMTINDLQNQLSSKHIEVDDLTKKLSDAENTISTRDEEILMLQSHVSNFRQNREEFASTREALLELESKLTLTEAEKTAAENRYRELELIVDGLKREIETNKNILEEEKTKTESHETLQFELMTVKEKLTSAEEAVEKLKTKLESIESEKLELENRCSEFENTQMENNSLKKQVFEISADLKSQLESLDYKKLELESRCTELENFKIENDNLKLQISKLKSQLQIVESEKQELETRCAEFENIRIENENFKQRIFETEKTSTELKSQLESEKLKLENLCTELGNIRTENDSLKQQILESEKTSIELKNRSTELADFRNEIDDLKRQIFEMEKASEDLKSQLESLEFKKSELANQLDDLRTENESLKREILESEEVIKGLKSKLESLESEKSDFENRCTQLENVQTESESLKQQILESEKVIKRLKSELESFESEKSDFENRCTQFENIQIENENLKREILESEEVIKRLKSELESLELEKSDFENRCTQLENLKDEILESEEVIKGLKSKLESLESEKSYFESRYTQLENTQNENESLKQQVLESEEVIKRLKSELESFESEKSDFENRCTQFENIQIENENLKREILESEEVIKRLKTELESVESKNSDFENVQIENANLKQQIFDIGQTTEAIKSQLESFESEKIALEKQCTELQNYRVECDDLKQKIFEIEKASEAVKSLTESLQSEKLGLEKRCAELENIRVEYNNFKQRIAETEKSDCTELENIRFENDSLKHRIFETEKSSEELKSQLESLKSEKVELDSLRIENDNLRKQIFEMEETSAGLKAQLESLESEKREMDNRCAELQRLLTENDNLKKRIFESEKLELENRCTELENTSAELKSQLELLESEKQELENRCAEFKNVRIENDKLKEKVFETEKVVMELNTELKFRQENEVKNVSKIEELFREIDQLKKHDIEFGDAVEETQNKLTNLLTGCELTNSELPSERIKKLFEDSKYIESKYISIIIQTVRKTCEGVENEMLRNFDSEKLEWETQKSQLCKQITESKNENENLLKMQQAKEIQLEKEIKLLQEQHEGMKNQLELTQNQQQELVGILKREIEKKEAEIADIQENLKLAEKTILVLKTQIKSFEVEKTEMENRYTELENNTDYEKIQTENDDLKERIFHSEKMMSELKNELEMAKENQRNNITKVEELIREIEELKRENNGFSNAVEETRNLADVLSDDANDSDLPGDRITKLIAKTSKCEGRIVSDFVETISKTCKGVQNEMIRKFDSKKLEWETQRDVDLRNLHQKIQTLTETNKELEAVVAQTKNELTIADDTIAGLKSQLTSAQTQQEAVENLKIEIDTKETIIKGLDEMKNLRENENSCLKKQVQESEELVLSLKKRLTTAEEELSLKGEKMQELLKEIDSLRKEIEFVTQKLEKVEKSNRNLMEVLSDVQTHLNIPDDNLLDCENKKIFSEKINAFVKTQLEGVEAENRSLKIRNENLKEEIKQLTKLIGETELKTANGSNPNNRTKSGRSMDLCVRRLDKLEEINHNLTELLTKILTMTEFADLEKLKLCSVREFPNVMKKVVTHVNAFLEKMKEMKEENGQLDEECETYSNIIKDLKKEAAVVWKDNKEKTEAFEAEIEKLKEEKSFLVKEKEELAGKILKLNEENLKLKSKTEGTLHTCTCGNESKKINELKRTILVKEQKLLELQDLQAHISSYKSQIEYLKTALEREKKKIVEEKEKNKKLQNELNEATKREKTENKKPEENQVLDELRMRGSISGGIVQEFVDKEKMRKLSKDIGILKELCRSRYAEIKRLEAVNAALRNGTPKNSNQMNSPIHTRGYNTRSKNQVRDFWKTEISGKENGAL